MNSCPKELICQSNFSPSIVENEEEIGYILLYPDHIDNGELTNTAFSKSKLKQGSLSITRISYTNEDEIKEQVIQPQINRNPNRQFKGLFVVKCSKIRSIKVEPSSKSRAICVLDDGIENYIAHAVLSFASFPSQPNFWNKNKQISIRAKLIDVFNKNGILQFKDVFI